MTRLKVFSTGNHGFIGPDVRDALGLPQHIRQARVLIVAATKRAASAMTDATYGIGFIRPTDSELRVAASPDVDALAEAGVLDRERVLVTGDTGAPSNGHVVDVAADGTITTVGRLKQAAGYRCIFQAIDH